MTLLDVLVFGCKPILNIHQLLVRKEDDKTLNSEISTVPQ